MRVFGIEKLSEEVCKMYTAEIVTALQNMHKSKIMHRDLKPENILLDQDLHLKIVSKTEIFLTIFIIARVFNVVD